MQEHHDHVPESTTSPGGRACIDTCRCGAKRLRVGDHDGPWFTFPRGSWATLVEAVAASRDAWDKAEAASRAATDAALAAVAAERARARASLRFLHDRTEDHDAAAMEAEEDDQVAAEWAYTTAGRAVDAVLAAQAAQARVCESMGAWTERTPEEAPEEQKS